MSAVLFSMTAFSQAYSSPESIEFDYANNRWFISNNGNGQILERNSATGVRSIFATGIPSGPHGLEIVNDTLYVCDGGSLKAYNINTAALVFNISLGGSFLNGITHDNSGYLYITDFSAYKIFRFNITNRSFTTFVPSTILGTVSPNGIIFDQPNNRCVFVNWGASAPIKAVDLTTAVVTTVTPTTLGNCDGIAKDGAGNYYVSSWSGGSKVTRFTNTFTTPTTVISTGLSNPADIFYNVVTDTLGVPNSGAGNNTTYHYFGTSTSIVETEDDRFKFSVSPNPITKTAEIKYELEEQGHVYIHLFDVKGQLVKTIVDGDSPKGPHSLLFDRLMLSAGNYFFTISTAQGTETKKVVIAE